MIDFDEEMESSLQGELGFENEVEETPPPLPPPYKETSLKQTLVSTSMHTDCPFTAINILQVLLFNTTYPTQEQLTNITMLSRKERKKKNKKTKQKKKQTRVIIKRDLLTGM